MHKTLKNLLKTTAVAASVGFASSAFAVPIVAVFNIAALGPVVADTSSVQAANTITPGAPNVVAFVQESNIDVVTGDGVLLLPDPMGVRVGDVFTKEFSTDLGTFLETLTVTDRNPTANALGILASGMIVQTAGTGFDPTPVFWSAAYTQNGGPGAQINGSYNNSTVPFTDVPAPATLALYGLGLAVLGFVRRRRHTL